MERDYRDFVPYQSLLRAVGAVLDECHAVTATVVETPDGFAVRYRGSEEPRATHLLQLSFDTLRDAVENHTHRTMRPRFLRRSAGAQADKYTDLLRAVGIELEKARAYGMLMDEVDEDILLTYQYLDPARGYLVRKHHAVIASEEQERLVADARRRRRQ